MTTIGDESFEGSFLLAQCKIGNFVTSMETKLFTIANLSTIAIPGNVKIIGNGVIDIGDEEFISCKLLDSISWGDNLETNCLNVLLKIVCHWKLFQYKKR